MITEKQFAEQEATYALKQLKEAFTKRANAMRDMADALDKRVEELGKPNEIKGMRITDADRSNWAVNEIENLGEGGTPGPCASGVDKKPGSGKTYLGSLSKAKAEAFVAANPGTSHTEEKNAYGKVIGHKVHSEHSPDTKEYFLHQKALFAYKGGDVTKPLVGDYKHGLVKKSSTTNTEVTSSVT